MDEGTDLIGTWRGGGGGTWPTSGEFSYEEEIVFESGHGGDDFQHLAYRERAWNAETGETIHAERGFWRFHEGGGVDVTLAHPIGVTEIAEGHVDAAGTITLVSERIGVGDRGLRVTGLRRTYRVDGDGLEYAIDLATDEVELARHLEGRLKRS
jgi:hypothetical protein